MDRDKWIRGSLWASFPFNLVAAFVFAFPGSAPGRLAGMPVDAPLVYRVSLSFLIALFGVAYAWMAARPSIPKPLLGFSAIGKAGVFVMAIALCLAGGATWRLVVVSIGDLLFAGVWFWWLREEFLSPSS